MAPEVSTLWHELFPEAQSIQMVQGWGASEKRHFSLTRAATRTRSGQRPPWTPEGKCCNEPHFAARKADYPTTGQGQNLEMNPGWRLWSLFCTPTTHALAGRVAEDDTRNREFQVLFGGYTELPLTRVYSPLYS